MLLNAEAGREQWERIHQLMPTPVLVHAFGTHRQGSKVETDRVVVDLTLVKIESLRSATRAACMLNAVDYLLTY